MKKIALLAALPATLLLFTSCSTPAKVDKSTEVAFQAGVPGGVLLESYQTIARVIGVDATNREVTLLAPDGSRNTFKAVPQNTSFTRFHLGDTVNASVTRQLVVFLSKDGAPPIDAQVALPSKLDPKHVLTSEMRQRTAKVGALDLKHHRATLQFADGISKTFDIRKDVELAQVKLGDEVIIRTTSSVTMALAKPETKGKPAGQAKRRNAQ